MEFGVENGLRIARQEGDDVNITLAIRLVYLHKETLWV